MVYGITNKSQIIDKATIINGCERLREAANDFETSGNSVSIASEDCGIDVLSVDDMTFAPIIEELGKSIKDVKKVIDGYADDIESLVNQIYTDQTAELAEYERKLQETQNNNNI